MDINMNNDELDAEIYFEDIPHIIEGCPNCSNGCMDCLDLTWRDFL